MSIEAMKHYEVPVAWLYDFLDPDNRDEVIEDWLTQNFDDIERDKGFNVRPLYTHPKREWVSLTDEERNYIWDVIGNSDAHGDVDGWSGRHVMDAIEAKLKEKNSD